jgi:outer membrane protein
MKRIIYMMMAITLLIFIWSASALAVEKIGFVNLLGVMQSSDAGKKSMEDLKKYYEKQSQDIKAAEKELKKMGEELEKQGAIMTQSSRKEKEAAYQKKMRDWQLSVNDVNEEVRTRDQEVTQKLMPGIIKIVRSLAEKEKYTLVVDVTNTPVPFIYYDKENDLTKRVIEEFNRVK